MAVDDSDIPRAFDRKPDSSEPWRYVSPCCRRQVRGSNSAKRGYRCNGCDTYVPHDDLLDRKETDVTQDRWAVVCPVCGDLGTYEGRRSVDGVRRADMALGGHRATHRHDGLRVEYRSDRR